MEASSTSKNTPGSLIYRMFLFFHLGRKGKTGLKCNLQITHLETKKSSEPNLPDSVPSSGRVKLLLFLRLPLLFSQPKKCSQPKNLGWPKFLHITEAPPCIVHLGLSKQNTTFHIPWKPYYPVETNSSHLKMDSWLEYPPGN